MDLNGVGHDACKISPLLQLYNLARRTDRRTRTTESETEVEHLSCQSDISRAIGAANPRAQMARAGPALRFLKGDGLLLCPHLAAIWFLSEC